MRFPRYGFFARRKDGFRGWRDGTRHRPGVNRAEDVRPAGYWNRLRQVPGVHYAEIDKEVLRVSGDLQTRLRQLKHDVDLLQVEVAERQQHANNTHDAELGQHQVFKAETRLSGQRRKLREVLQAFEACRTRATALEQQAQVAKQAVYEHAKERFSVYIGKLINYHRRGDLIQSAVNDRYSELGPLPPTPSIFAVFAATREPGSAQAGLDDGK